MADDEMWRSILIRYIAAVENECGVSFVDLLDEDDQDRVVSLADEVANLIHLPQTAD